MTNTKDCSADCCQSDAVLALQRHLFSLDINAKQGVLTIQLHHFLLASPFFLSNSNSDDWRSKTHFQSWQKCLWFSNWLCAVKLWGGRQSQRFSDVIAERLKRHKMKVLEWHRQSPDLNLFELLWQHLKQAARKPSSVAEVNSAKKSRPTFLHSNMKDSPQAITNV